MLNHINNASIEDLRQIAIAALALSSKMVDTEKYITDTQSSFEVEREWQDLTTCFAKIQRD